MGEKIQVGPEKLKVFAVMIHEANKVLCESQGDNSQEHWNEAPGYNHQSATLTVRALFKNPDLTPSDLHDIWMDGKKADGWSYGETKDRDKKTHPSMIPYADLSALEKYKDRLVLNIVLSYIDEIGRESYVLVDKDS
jgi:hypothetical protein